jgi:hypothetical protein
MGMVANEIIDLVRQDMGEGDSAALLKVIIGI